MLRIGKNKDQEENDHSNQKPEVPDYAAKSYPSYQTTSVEPKPAAAEPAGEKMPTDKLVDVSPLALRMSSPFNAGYWLAAA